LKGLLEAISNTNSCNSLTSPPLDMETKKRRQPKGTMIIGKGAATVKIYPFTRKDGYKQNNVCWHEGGRRRTRCFSDFAEAEMIAQQISVRLANKQATGKEATHRDIEILQHCEALVRPFDTALVAAVEEWATARKAAPEVSLSDAVRFYVSNGPDRFPDRTTTQVAAEFVTSLERKGVSDSYVSCARGHLDKFSGAVTGKIAEVKVADINHYLSGLKHLGAVSKNGIRRNIVTMFSFAKKQGYLHPDRKTAAELSEKFKEEETEIAIFTPDEMQRILLAAHDRILPFLAIGAFAGIRSAEIHRLDWEDIKWDRGHIEIAGRKAKTAARRLAILPDNLKAWLMPWREAIGPIVPISDTSGALGDLGIKAQIPGGWRQNGLRHSFISYRVAETGDVARTALEAGNSPKMIFRHYREVVTQEDAKAWFSIMPPEVWPPADWRLRFRTKKQ
jgi:integrase